VGAYLERLSLDPVIVTVTGPAAELGGLTGISLQPVDLASLPSGTSQFPLRTQAPAADVKVSPDRVLLSLVVAEPLAQRTFLFTALPFTGLDPADQATYAPFTGSVVISGTTARLAQLAQADLGLSLDLSGLAPASTPYPVRVSVTVPSGTTLVSVSPPSVPVTITVRQ
jgi:YbbR domain-containing protein